MGAIDYDESITSLLYPGNTLSQSVLQAAVAQLEQVLPVPAAERPQVCLRMDAGFGTDENLRWVLRQGYQLIAKNNSGRRAGLWGQHVTEWQVVEPDHRWVGVPEDQLEFARPTRTIAVRWRDHHQDRLKHALYVVTDLQASPLELCRRYDLRGGLESDIRDDKQGLQLAHRRKRRWAAQEALVLLNDLAHNVVSMFRREVLAGTPFAQWGAQRVIRDVLAIPGEAVICDGQLTELRLSQTHPCSAVLLDVLPRLWQ